MATPVSPHARPLARRGTCWAVGWKHQRAPALAARPRSDSAARRWNSLGVDGSASNEASSLLDDVRQAVYMAGRSAGQRRMSVRQALRMATRGNAQVLGRADDIGALEPGKLADIALWRLDTLPHAGIADPVAALVLGVRPLLKLLLVNGLPVIEHDRLVTVDEDDAAAAAGRASARAAASR